MVNKTSGTLAPQQHTNTHTKLILHFLVSHLIAHVPHAHINTHLQSVKNETHLLIIHTVWLLWPTHLHVINEHTHISFQQSMHLPRTPSVHKVQRGSPHVSSAMGRNVLAQHSAPSQPFAEQAALFLIRQKNKHGKSNYTLTHIASRVKLSHKNKPCTWATNVMINENGAKIIFWINFQNDTQ